MATHWQNRIREPATPLTLFFVVFGREWVAFAIIKSRSETMN